MLQNALLGVGSDMLGQTTAEKKLRERANVISKDVSQLVDFVKGNPRATRR